MDINDISRELFEYLRDVIDMSPDNIRTVKSAIALIKEQSPSDIPLILRKMERLVDIQQDMSWILLVMRRKLHELIKDMKVKKDPAYVMLVKQGRPSSSAIEAEIRFTNKDLYKTEDDIEIVKNVIEYFQKLVDSIEKYTWLLKDKLSTEKM